MGEPSHWKPEAFDWDQHKFVAKAREADSQSSPSGSEAVKEGKLLLYPSKLNLSLQCLKDARSPD